LNRFTICRQAFANRFVDETPQAFWHDSNRGLRLYQGDALELLRRAKSGTFDFIFADPPYFPFERRHHLPERANGERR
jgi:16S rRNA G966 N2-methylase RsmD